MVANGDVDVVATLQEQETDGVRAVRREHVAPSHERVEAREVEVAGRLTTLAREMTAGRLLDAAELEQRTDPFVVER